MLSEAHPRHEIHAWHPDHGYGAAILHPRTWHPADMATTVALRAPCRFLRLVVRDAAGELLANGDLRLGHRWYGRSPRTPDPRWLSTDPQLGFQYRHLRSDEDGVVMLENCVAGTWQLTAQDNEGAWFDAVFDVPSQPIHAAELQLRPR